MDRPMDKARSCMMLRIRQRVVLVGWPYERLIAGWRNIGALYPSVGEVYTIRAIKPWKASPVLLLCEIDNSHLGFPLEPGFRQEFFRPIVERKTNISALKALLVPANKQAEHV